MSPVVTNGICTFDPTSRRGKWMFIIQTLVLSFVPITVLIVQNSIQFRQVLMQKQYVQDKTILVTSDCIQPKQKGLVRDYFELSLESAINSFYYLSRF